jgi:hypothetical protein
MKMSTRSVIENNIVIIFLGVAVSSFGAGWLAHNAIQDVSGVVPISRSEIRELERMASLGKEDVIRENLALKENEKNLEKRILQLHDEIRLNRQEAKVTITNIVLDPPSPATLHAGDEITVEFDYDIAKAGDIEIGVGIHLFGPRVTLTGKGRTKQKVRLHKDTLSLLPAAVNNNRILEAIYVYYFEPIPGGYITKSGETVRGKSGHLALTIPVAYKIKLLKNKDRLR